MIYREWIATQDQSRWNDLDPASIQMILDWFGPRQVIDDIEHSFWNYVNIYRPGYVAQLRIQAANQTFDPLVTRYLEALSQTKGSNVNVGSRGTVTEGRVTRGNSRVWAGDDLVHVEEGRDDDPYTVTETLSFKDREHKTTKDGKRSVHKHGSGENNYTKDAQGSKETVTHLINEQTTTKKSGTQVTESDRMNAENGTRAERAAPMTAVNLTRQQSAGDKYVNIVQNGSLGPQDWSSASAYAETSGQSGETGKTKVYYEGDETLIETDGRKKENQDETTYARNQQTSTDITDDETFDRYSDTATDKGEETRSTKYENTQHSDITRDEKITHAPLTDTGNEESFGSSSETSKDTVESSGENWNRYTGREGLSPQEGFRQALEYLQAYPNAIMWFIEKLEPCFIGVLEV